MVRLKSKITFDRMCLTLMLGGAGIAGLILAWPAGTVDREPTAAVAKVAPSPAPARAPAAATFAAMAAPSRAIAAPQPARHVAADATAQAWHALFNPKPVYAPAVNETKVAAAAPPAPARAAVPAASPPSRQHVALANPAPRKPAPRTVLNDTQIAQIKARLNLTPEQEKSWPAVETALRKLAYSKKPRENAATAIAAIDPDDPNLVQLKSAAVPLVMSFSAEQTQELRTIATMAGLDKLLPQY